jgi:hypothetical protein
VVVQAYRLSFTAARMNDTGFPVEVSMSFARARRL